MEKGLHAKKLGHAPVGLTLGAVEKPWAKAGVKAPRQAGVVNWKERWKSNGAVGPVPGSVRVEEPGAVAEAGG